MDSTAIRLPRGLRTISDVALLETLYALKETKHPKLVAALVAILAPEADRRGDPLSEPAWPSLDLSDWQTSSIYTAIRECLTLGSILREEDSRGLFRTVGYILWSEFRLRVGDHLLPFSEPTNEGNAS